MTTATDRSGTEAIPLTVLTGFLGAGKTTLLNRILTGDHGLRIAVLVNDFGSINIDADLVVGVESDGDIISLANGCVCCNVRDDLVAAVTQVMAGPSSPSTSCSRPAEWPSRRASHSPSWTTACGTASGWTASCASSTRSRYSPRRR